MQLELLALEGLGPRRQLLLLRVLGEQLFVLLLKQGSLLGLTVRHRGTGVSRKLGGFELGASVAGTTLHVLLLLLAAEMTRLMSKLVRWGEKLLTRRGHVELLVHRLLPLRLLLLL